MALTDKQQINKLIEDANNILISFRKNGAGDAIAASLGLALFLQKQGKHVDIVADEFSLPTKFQFLKDADKILSSLPHLQKFMITIDVGDVGVQELSYDVRDQKLHIFVTPKSGFLTREHVQTAQSEWRHDLIIVLDSPDMESLGNVFTKNAELFYKLPVINIDQKPDNEHFGQINMVDLTASATSEVVANLLRSIHEETIDADIATALLTGMIAKTQSFKTENIKPHTLSLASKLVSMGADRDGIIKRLYQTKSLSMLRLWGEALARINYDKELGLVSTTITREDFSRSGATEQELYDIIDELIVNSPEEEMTLLLHEHPKNGHDGPRIHGILNTEKKYNAKELAAAFQPTGDAHQVSFVITDKSLKQAQDVVTEEIRKRVKELGLK